MEERDAAITSSREVSVPPLQRFAIDQSGAGLRWSQRAYLHMFLPGSPPRMRRLAVALLVLTVPLVLLTLARPNSTA